MKQIEINSKTHGIHIMMVDDEDFEMVNSHTWHIIPKRDRNKSCYAATHYRVNGEQKSISAHRFIMGLWDEGRSVMIDHIDHNGLNNQKSNLRKCSHEENARNRTLNKNTTTGYKGVQKTQYKRKIKDGEYVAYWAKIAINNKLKHIGTFKTAKEAALAYNKEAKKHYGEFAYINEI